MKVVLTKTTHTAHMEVSEATFNNSASCDEGLGFLAQLRDILWPGRGTEDVLFGQRRVPRHVDDLAKEMRRDGVPESHLPNVAGWGKEVK